MSIFGQNNNTGGSQPSNNIFGNAQGSGGASNNVFGGGLNTGAKPATGGGLFGSTPSIFGSGNTSAPASGGGLFGGGASGNTATTSAGGGGLFGGGAPAAPATAPSNPNPLFGGGAAATNTSSAPTSAPLFGGGSTTTGTGGGLFGGSGASTSTNTNPLFGGQPSSTAPASGGLFGPPKTDQNASKPAQSNFFSNPSTSSAPATGSAPAPIGGLFGSTAPKPADASTPAAPAAAPSGGLFGGGGLFGKKPEAPAAGAGTTPAATLNPLFGNKDAGASSTAPPAAPSGGLFGGGLGAKPTENAGAAPAAPTGGLFGPAKDTSAEKKDAAPGPAFNLFGAAKPATTTTEKKDAPAASGSALGSFSLGGAKEAEKPKDGAAPAATLAPVAVPPPSMLRGKTIEEIVNRWSSDLEIHVKEFNRFASEVAVWDRALIENGNNLAALYSHVLTAEREQNDIDQSLDHIEQQQRDLSATLDAYEKTTDEVLGGQGGSLRALDTGPADTERDKNYMLATDLHTHLDDLSGSLTQMIESVNALSLGPGPGENKSQGDDPMAQIAAILSSHLESLQWIDGAVREVESKVTDVERRVNLSGGGGGKSRGFGLNR